MADTSDISIIKTGWTLVVANGSKGLLTQSNGTETIVRKADSKPADTVETGHPIKNKDGLNVDLTDAAETGNLYARLDVVYNGQDSGTVIFTEA